MPTIERIRGIDWEKPQLLTWSKAIENYIDATPGRLLLVAHSFGCLAGAVAASRRPKKVAGLILVAPAAPQRFALTGPIDAEADPAQNISSSMPMQRLDIQGMLVASKNDPWMPFSQAEQLSQCWGLAFYNAGFVGHINSDSGYGEWPLIKELVLALQQKVTSH